MKRKRLLMVVGSICLSLMLVAILLPACAPEEEEPAAPAVPTVPTEAEVEVFKLKYQSSAFPGSYGYEIDEDLIQQIEMASNGRIQIEHYAANVVCSTMEMFDAVAAGALDLSSIASCWYQGIIPAARIEWGLVGGPDKWEEKIYLWWYLEPRSFDDVLHDAMLEHGVYTFSGGPGGTYGEFMSTVPINKMEDVDGLKIRSFGVNALIWEANGAALVTTAPGEEYTAVALGTIDALNRGGGRMFYDLKLHEVCQYFVNSAIGTSSAGPHIINPDVFNSLPDDLQQLLETIYRYSVAYSGIYVTYQNKLYVAKMVEEAGTTVIEWPKEEFDKVRALAMPIYGEIAEEEQDKYCTELKNILFDYMHSLGYTW